MIDSIIASGGQLTKEQATQLEKKAYKLSELCSGANNDSKRA